MSVGIFLSANDNWNDCLYDIDAAESFVIVHRRESFAEVE